MNLCVNLISEDERRSANPIQSKAMARTCGLLAASLVVLWVSMSVLSISGRRDQLDADNWKWRHLKDEYDAAVRTRANLDAAQARLMELSAYRRARVDWHLELRKLGGHVPTNVQLTEVRISQSLSTEGGMPCRAYGLRLHGRTSGPAASPTIKAFLAELSAHPDFTNLITAADIKSFSKDAATGAAEADRAFEIACTGKPRKLE
jgi:hypothetical protein